MIPLHDFKRAATLLFLFAALQLITACGDSQNPHFKLTGSTMGTSYHITVVSSDQVDISREDLHQAIEKQLALINRQMSTYDSASELSLLNKAAVDSWVEVSSNLFDVLVLSLELGWLSDGSLDITVGPLVNLWGFGPGGLNQADVVPPASKIEALKAVTGFEAIEFNLQNNGILKRRPVEIDLSAIAKGYAVDKVAELIRYAGYSNFMVEIGGELYLQGNSPKGKPWRIAIEQPDAASFGEVHQAVNITAGGMATSGDYRNFFELDGKRYSHTLDPRTGYPVSHSLVSVTVIAESAAYADGLATAINVMGPEKGLLLAQNQGLAVYMIIKTDQGFAVKYSEAFIPFLDRQ